MTTLHSVNAIRVIAEYFVVRLHTFASTVGMDNFVRDLMSFFFVLSGFVMMYTHYSASFSTTRHKWDFWVGRWRKTYPAYILNFSFQLPVVVVRAMDPNFCVYDMFCPLMQVFLLNCWAGCGIRHTINSLNWYLGALAWLWFAFPLIHGTLKRIFRSRIWIKLFFINVLSTSVIFVFSGYEIFTICTLPVLRLGEFIIGCGAACALEQLEQPEQMESRPLRLIQWVPSALIVIYMTVFYCAFALPHGMSWICMNEWNQNFKCNLWEKSEWVDVAPPCLAVWDKYFNKHALLWAVVIHTIASAEKSNDTNGVLMQVLGHGIFKTLSSYSLSLYLGHMSIDWVLRTVTNSIGWVNFWHDDVRLIVIYALCYVLHLFTQKITSIVFKPWSVFTQV